MTQPLLAQRSRGDLIAELYDRHATGLFAYCHDQLGDAASAADALTSVLAVVTAENPPRAALYALARREIHQRDVVYAPLSVGADPASALVERVLRELRPHQREVLYLSGMCEMDTSELSWVLDVAGDTADELTVSACRRFAQSLSLALAGAPVPDHLADVFGAMSVAPIRDVLTRAPWAVPPVGLRAALLGPRAVTATAARRAPSPLVKQLWPTTPAWPLPLAETGPPTGLSSPGRLQDPASPPDRFPDPFSPSNRSPDPFSPPDPAVVSAHEAATAPMPKIRDSVLTALDDNAGARVSRLRLQRPKPRRAIPLSAPIPADVLDDAPAENLFRPLTPEVRVTPAPADKLVASASSDETSSDTSFSDTTVSDTTVSDETPPGEMTLDEAVRDMAARRDRASRVLPLPGWPLQTDQLDALARHEQPPLPRWLTDPDTPADSERAQPPLPDWFTDRDHPGPGPQHDQLPYAKPVFPSWSTHVYQPGAPAPYEERPDGLDLGRAPRTAELAETSEMAAIREPEAAASAPDPANGHARHKHKVIRYGRRHHHDWAWELIGFVIALAIAMIVFFAVPMLGTP
ncbi:hypothetical protein AB0M44_39000 [Streptosporangium subroseum]|uniref:hypothetical protein n=1 Tax=Streptosporangium subroseum TaxID=106412 RepID=UPI00344531D7